MQENRRVTRPGSVKMSVWGTLGDCGDSSWHGPPRIFTCAPTCSLTRAVQVLAICCVQGWSRSWSFALKVLKVIKPILILKSQRAAFLEFPDKVERGCSKSWFIYDGATAFTRTRESEIHHCFCAPTRIWNQISQIPNWLSCSIHSSRDSQPVL